MEAICHVSLQAISHNFKYFQERVSPAQIIPVVKANAYGHGALKITQHLHDSAGVNLVAVATLEEARSLAAFLPTLRILIFSRVFHAELSALPENAILSIGSMEDALALQAHTATALKVHLNINTGMNRLGLTPAQALELLSTQDSKFTIEGVYSHFSSSDTLSDAVYAEQNAMFQVFVDQIRGLGFKGMVHHSNSAAALHDTQNYFDAIRLGISLYGYDTTAKGRHQKFLKPVMSIRAPLVRVARIAAGESVSYAEKWQPAVATNIGTLRIGYADGYRRDLTNRGKVALGDRIYPVVGTVTMDHIMIDLGADSPATGTMFDVMGGGMPDLEIASISQLLHTIPYEICCSISSRVRRVY